MFCLVFFKKPLLVEKTSLSRPKTFVHFSVSVKIHGFGQTKKAPKNLLSLHCPTIVEKSQKGVVVRGRGDTEEGEPNRVIFRGLR